eukprot:XP_014629658.1 protein transport protein Sec61 subunit beta-like [Glycine max]
MVKSFMQALNHNYRGNPKVLNPPLQQPRDQDQQAWLPAVSPPPLPACAVATTGMHRRRLDNRNSSTSTVIRGGGSNMLRFYTDDAPGLKISPTMVLVMSFCFIGFTTLHVFDKLYRSKSGGVV